MKNAFKELYFVFFFWLSIISGVLGAIVLFFSENWAGGLFASSSAVMAYVAKTYWNKLYREKR